MPNNLTDNEIKKALESCMKGYCDDCPFRKTREHCHSIDGLLLDLINRLQAENERLSKITRPLIAEIKAEAMTEFADKVHTEIHQALESNYKARKERIAHYENKGEMFIGDDFVHYCDGKIDCLRGIDDFIDETYNEMVGE